MLVLFRYIWIYVSVKCVRVRIKLLYQIYDALYLETNFILSDSFNVKTHAVRDNFTRVNKTKDHNASIWSQVSRHCDGERLLLGFHHNLVRCHNLSVWENLDEFLGEELLSCLGMYRIYRRNCYTNYLLMRFLLFMRFLY